MDHDPASLQRRTVLKMLCAFAGMGLTSACGGVRDAQVIRRKIPSSGEGLPIVGLGTSRVFDVDESPEARAPLLKVLQHLTEEGGSVVDTSPMYGRAEQVTGDLIGQAGLREKIFMATKVWTRGRDEGIRQMDESFRLLGVRTMDLMQVHNLMDWETHLQTLAEWKEAGRVRYVGITHYRTDAFDSIETLMREQTLDFVQLNYSILTLDAEEILLPLAADRGIAVLVNRPYERGAVFAKVSGREIPPWAAEQGIATWGQFFLKWVLSNEAVTCVIPGTSKPHHMLDNLAAGMGRLPDAPLRKQMRAFISSI